MISERSVIIEEPEDNYTAMIEMRGLLQDAGFDKTTQTLVATVVSELATNIIRYANNGEMHMRVIEEGERVGVELVASDKGPGIEDVEKACEAHFTTTKNSLGLGLSSLKRIMDDVTIDSKKGCGTTIVAKKWKRNL